MSASGQPDVQVGDVWRDDHPIVSRQRTVTVDRICTDESYSTDEERREAQPLPHAHVVASPSGRRSVIAIRRFRPGKRGYTLIERDGQAVTS